MTVGGMGVSANTAVAVADDGLGRISPLRTLAHPVRDTNSKNNADKRVTQAMLVQDVGQSTSLRPLTPPHGAALDVEDFNLAQVRQHLGLLDPQRLLLRGTPAGQPVFHLGLVALL
jgi:hypothetical protein